VAAFLGEALSAVRAPAGLRAGLGWALVAGPQLPGDLRAGRAAVPGRCDSLVCTPWRRNRAAPCWRRCSLFLLKPIGIPADPGHGHRRDPAALPRLFALFIAGLFGKSGGAGWIGRRVIRSATRSTRRTRCSRSWSAERIRAPAVRGYRCSDLSPTRCSASWASASWSTPCCSRIAARVRPEVTPPSAAAAPAAAEAAPVAAQAPARGACAARRWPRHRRPRLPFPSPWKTVRASGTGRWRCSWISYWSGLCALSWACIRTAFCCWSPPTVRSCGNCGAPRSAASSVTCACAAGRPVRSTGRPRSCAPWGASCPRPWPGLGFIWVVIRPGTPVWQRQDRGHRCSAGSARDHRWSEVPPMCPIQRQLVPIGGSGAGNALTPLQSGHTDGNQDRFMRIASSAPFILVGALALAVRLHS